MSRINLLHIVQHSAGGGVIKQLYNILKAYDKEIINPVVCSLGGKGATGDLIEKSGIEFVPLWHKNNDRLIPSAIASLRKLMIDKHIEIVRTHGYGANLNGRIAALMCHVPCIASIHNIYTKERKTRRRLANHLLGMFPSRVVAVSEAVRRDVIKYDCVEPSKVIVIRNGVDTEHFVPGVPSEKLRHELGFIEHDFVIGFIGRVVPAKGLPWLLEAFADVKKHIDNVKLLIVGKGSSLHALEGLSKELGLQEDILFTGERNDISELLLLMDVFVMPSEKEGLPNALLEAMSAARPVLVTEAGGMKEIVQDKISGYVVPVGNPGRLAEGLRRLISDRESAERMGQAARAYIEMNFSIEATARKWAALYRNILVKSENPIAI